MTLSQKNVIETPISASGIEKTEPRYEQSLVVGAERKRSLESADSYASHVAKTHGIREVAGAYIASRGLVATVEQKPCISTTSFRAASVRRYEKICGTEFRSASHAMGDGMKGTQCDERFLHQKSGLSCAQSN